MPSSHSQGPTSVPYEPGSSCFKPVPCMGLLSAPEHPRVRAALRYRGVKTAGGNSQQLENKVVNKCSGPHLRYTNLEDAAGFTEVLAMLSPSCPQRNLCNTPWGWLFLCPCFTLAAPSPVSWDQLTGKQLSSESFSQALLVGEPKLR